MTQLLTTDNTDTTIADSRNIALLGFKMAVNDGLTVFNLVDGVVDEFHDESGADEGEGSNDTYNSTDDYYRNMIYIKYIVPAWSGARQLKISSSSHQNGNQMEFHQITDWDGAGSVTNRFCNTSLFVYSI